VAIGGLTEIGYASETDLLLVVSAQGRGVFDCATGERLARDYEEPSSAVAWYDDVGLSAVGIGPRDGYRVRLAGLMGGGLRHVTGDGWGLQAVSPDWPQSFVVLSSPGVRRAIFNDPIPNEYTRVAPSYGSYAITAFGFSETGLTFIVAMSHTLETYGRPWQHAEQSDQPERAQPS